MTVASYYGIKYLVKIAILFWRTSVGFPELRLGPGLGSDYRLAAMPFAHFAIKAQRRKAARLRKLRRRFIRPRRRGTAIPPARFLTPLPFESPPSIPKEKPPPCGGGFSFGGQGGIPRLRAGRLGLQHAPGMLPRALGSNPTLFYAKIPAQGRRFSHMADRVGFEPTSLLRDYLISSQGRYDHFDTCPSVCCVIIPKAQEKIKSNLNQIVHI